MTLAMFLPGWLTVPTSAIAMLIVAAHLIIVERRTTQTLRRRIRLVNGWVMLVAIPLLAAGFSFIDPDVRPRMFTLVWLAVIGLVLISIVLALTDLANTFMHARRARRAIRMSRRRLEESFHTSHGCAGAAERDENE